MRSSLSAYGRKSMPAGHSNCKKKITGTSSSAVSVSAHDCDGPEEVRQEAGPDVIWRPADAAWLHSFRVWTSHCLYLGLYLDHAYLYLRLYLRGTVHCLLAYFLVNPKNWSPWWKLAGTAVKKPQVWSPLSLYRHVIISFMTFWPCRTSSDYVYY